MEQVAGLHGESRCLGDLVAFFLKPYYIIRMLDGRCAIDGKDCCLPQSVRDRSPDKIGINSQPIPKGTRPKN
jgi:hypothetical protein